MDGNGIFTGMDKYNHLKFKRMSINQRLNISKHSKYEITVTAE